MTTRSSAKILHVFSIDSACVFNKSYQQLAKTPSPLEHRAIAANQELNHYVQTALQDSTCTPIFISSSIRQSNFLDDQSSQNMKTGLFNEALRALSQHTAIELKRDVSFDPFLLQDIFSTAPNESSKFLLLYAQMHRIASLNSDTEILFHFIDTNEFVLNHLKNFFKDHPQLKPPKLTLKFIHDQDEKSSLIADAKNQLDYNYRTNIQKFYENYKKEFNPNGTRREQILQDLIDAKTDIIQKFIELPKSEKIINNPVKTSQITLKPTLNAVERARRDILIYRANRFSYHNKKYNGEYYSIWGKWHGMSFNVKKNASQKLLALLDGSPVTLTQLELNALHDGDLGKTFAKHKHLPAFIPLISKLQQEDKIKVHIHIGRLHK